MQHLDDAESFNVSRHRRLTLYSLVIRARCDVAYRRKQQVGSTAGRPANTGNDRLQSHFLPVHQMASRGDGVKSKFSHETSILPRECIQTTIIVIVELNYHIN